MQFSPRLPGKSKRKWGIAKPGQIGKGKLQQRISGKMGCRSRQKVGCKQKVRIGNKIKLINSEQEQLQPVVLLRNIFAGYTLTRIVTQRETGTVSHQQQPDPDQNVSSEVISCQRRIPVVVLVDCLNLGKLPNNGAVSSTPVETPPVKATTMADLGLREYKLSQVKVKTFKPTVTPAVITQFLVDAVSLGNAPNRHNRPFDLYEPHEECAAIVEALIEYANCVSPLESFALFCSSEANLCKSIQSSGDPTVKRCSVSKGGRSVRKGWIFVTTLGSSHFFSNLKLVPGRKHAFEKKMLSIMKAGMEVDLYNWTLSEVGYIFSFWLAKLYNSQGVPDDNLPKELVLAKEHFLELRGWQYDDAIIVTK